MNDNAKPTFVLVPTDLIEIVGNGKLSKEAAWLYVVLLSHHNRSRRDDDVWPSRQVLADKCGLKKPDSVDKYLAELRDAGLIVSEQRRRVGNLKTSSKHTLLLTVAPTIDEIESRRKSADTPASGYRYPVQRVNDAPPRGDELEERELDQLKDSEVSSPTSSRFAPDGGRHENSEPQHPHEQRVYENWHARDRQEFKELVGEILISVGGRGWNKGRHTADQFYNAYRMRQEGTKRWPGQYLKAISGGDRDAVDDWLIDQGLHRPEWQ